MFFELVQYEILQLHNCSYTYNLLNFYVNTFTEKNQMPHTHFKYFV